ncbi:MAG: DUF5681 domain-containing protein [Pseudomonadota bacterium]
MADVDQGEIKRGESSERDEKGRLLPGVKLNPAGRPPGSVRAELVALIKRIGAEERNVEITDGGQTRQVAMANLEILVRRLYRDGQSGVTQATHELLDRGWGKAVQPVEFGGTNGEGIRIIVNTGGSAPMVPEGDGIRIVEGNGDGA